MLRATPWKQGGREAVTLPAFLRPDPARNSARVMQLTLLSEPRGQARGLEHGKTALRGQPCGLEKPPGSARPLTPPREAWGRVTAPEKPLS